MRQQINFYSGKIRRAQRLTPLFYIAACVIMGIALASTWGLQQRKILSRDEIALEEIKKSLAEARAILEKNNKDATPIPLDASLDGTLEILDKKVKLREALVQAVDAQLARGATSIAPFFITLAKNHRDGIWLTSVRLHRGKGIVSIHGKTVEPALVSAYLKQLSGHPEISKAGFDYLRLTLPKDSGADDKSGKTSKKTDPPSEFVLTTDENEARELMGETTTPGPGLDDKNLLKSDFLKDSFQYIEQLKMMAR